MIRRAARSRSGITLTEILISILIMGVGVISLATLFPIGLSRLHAAAKWSRSTYLGESASSEINTRNLFAKVSFLNAFISPWYVGPAAATPAFPNRAQWDPWIQDTPSYGADWVGGAYRGSGGTGDNNLGQNLGIVPRPGTGIYVAYDPLWWFQSGLLPNNGTVEARFASGVGFIRKDPDGNPASAYGLQRLTNMAGTPQLANQVPGIFVSPEDLVLNDSDAAKAQSQSPTLPDLTSGATVNDWRYSWMFTGYQTDSANGTVFDGEIVVFENRPFGIETMPSSNGGGTIASGERVVEAIFGSSSNVYVNPAGNGTGGYGTGADKTVLLRWPASDPDPEVKVGGWIADVTYERISATDDARRIAMINAQATDRGNIVIYPYQRCYWYQIAKKSAVGLDTVGDPATSAGYRSMTVTVSTPLRAKTFLAAGGAPLNLNAALIAPQVANVISRTVYTR